MGDRFGLIDFDEFHLDELPRRLQDGNGALAAGPLAGARPIAFKLPDGRAYTYTPTPDGLRVTTGDGDAVTVVELDHAAWCDFVHELKSSFALLYSDQLTISRGTFGHLARWEPGLRAAFDGQTVYDLTDPAPVHADLRRSFTLDASDDELRSFLDETGFLHLRGVLDAGEIAALSDAVDESVEGARPEDGRSWWTTVDGEDACCRVNYLAQQFPAVDALSTDPRFARIGTLGGGDLQVCPDRLDGHGVVIKVPGSQGGLADLPWHRDCGMGGHPVKCPMLNVGIQLDAATARTGQLRFIAGSHRGTSPMPGDDVEGLPVIAIDTEPGDVTIHYGHTLHAAPPPADATAFGRRALYLSFVPRLTFELMAPGQGYNDVLFTRDAGHIAHIDEFA